MRGQISFEYLVIVGIAILIIVPTLLFFLSFSQGNEDTAVHSAVNGIGLSMLDISSEVYSLGIHSWNTLDVNVPESVTGIYLSNQNELVIQYYTKYGLTDAVFYPVITLTNATDTIQLIDPTKLNPVVIDRTGIVSLRFTSQGTNVSISVEDG